MSKLRTANLLAALACEIADRLTQRPKQHPNQTDSGVAALNLISFYEGCSNGALSRALKLSHPATVRLVDKLEAEGLVESRSGQDDRRAVALYLTAAGRERARTAVQERCVALGDLVDVLTVEQQAQLDGIAETLLKKLTVSAAEADHICRLCDVIACSQDRCPVHQTALGLAGNS